MKSPRELLPVVAVAVPGIGLLLGVFTQLYRNYPALGRIDPYGFGLGVALGIICAVWFYVTGGHRGETRKSTIGTYVFIAIFAPLTGILWAPCINALLDFGPETTVVGTIERIKDPGKDNPSRVVTAVIDGTQRQGKFYALNFWDVAAVREGGPVQLTVRPGFLGIPWVTKFSDP